MFDFSHLPNNANVWEFPYQGNPGAPAGISTNMAWQKPSNAKFILMIAIGGGQGGDGGGNGASGTSRSGGSGGGSGAFTIALFHSFDVAQILYISFGTATGSGGSSGLSGGSGASVNICNVRAGVDISRYCFSSGRSGSGSNATTISTANLLSKSIFFASVDGRFGTFATNGLPANTSIGTASPILGGGGGGGVLTGVPTAFNGAGFTSEIPAILPDIAGGLASSALDASSGVRLPFVSVGGAGGGANNNGTGGRGGNGVGYGAGGGGGGAGVTGNGGRGGDGGPAYACIIAW